MPVQLQHFNTTNTKKNTSLVLVCDGVSSPSNVGSIFRICDAFGVSEIFFCNATINFKSPRLQKTARSTQKNSVFTECDSITVLLNKLRKKDFTLIALEITDSSISLEKLSILKNEKIALIIGNEQEGVSKKALKQVDEVVKIEMYGNNSSMNVVQATSIALYSIVNKL